jgi:hypothetical protein
MKSMQVFSVSYTFSQHFQVPAQAAFHWATDYKSNDLALMGEKGKRTIRKLTNDTIILKESILRGKKKITKVKLVRIHPRKLSWHNIHVQGPNKYSEFLYEIIPQGRNESRLTFTGLLVLYSEQQINPRRLSQIATSEKRYDAQAWRLLAKAMANDYRRKLKLPR